jgi:hypothetical protein
MHKAHDEHADHGGTAGNDEEMLASALPALLAVGQ